jgi:hypothetical protein
MVAEQGNAMSGALAWTGRAATFASGMKTPQPMVSWQDGCDLCTELLAEAQEVVRLHQWQAVQKGSAVAVTACLFDPARL